MSKNDGGPAFPIPYATDMDGYVYAPRADGMSKRDWFAGMALQGMCANPNTTMKDIHSGSKDLAEVAFIIADAMIAEGMKDE